MTSHYRIKYLSDLQAAYADGQIPADARLVIDNDSTSVWVDDEPVFEMHPAELLEEALALLGIPNEPA